jgi:ubiquinone/menaquinone biosynthesis C-methylase UbiE
MATSFKRKLLDRTNKVLGLAGLELIKKTGSFQDYIPFRKTLQDAERSGLSLCDYIDNNFNVPGVTQETIDKLAAMGALSKQAKIICEIGPGSGRYLEKVKDFCQPERYEIYETSKPWRDWLVEKHNVTALDADGASLSSTPDKSVDLIHTHKMLYGNPVITIFRYLNEMVRVVKDDGYIVFDLVTEECLTEDILKRWIESRVTHACGMTPKQYALDFFKTRGFQYMGGFIVPMAPGVTEYFVFRR